MMFALKPLTRVCRALSPVGQRLAAGLIVAFCTGMMLGCDGDQLGGQCYANVDCSGISACVDGQCIADVAQCNTYGAFMDITELPLPFETGEQGEQDTDTAVDPGAPRLLEAHAVVDAGGAVHLCTYSQEQGRFVGRYIWQTGWGRFDQEEVVTALNDPVRCGGLALATDGTAYLVSRTPPAVLTRTAPGSWTTAALAGLEGVEAQGAVAGDRTLITLTPDNQGGVYVGLSLGFELEAQPIYLAHVAGSTLNVLVNGWSELGHYTATGHAPQFLLQQNGVQVMLGSVRDFDIQLTDTALNVSTQFEGLYPRAVVDGQGRVLAAYLNRNFELHLNRVEGGIYTPFTNLGEVGLDESSEGQLPWDMAVDAAGTIHLLIEDNALGVGALMYRQVTTDGVASDARAVTCELADSLPGMQKYAMRTDICGRATIAMLERNEIDNQTVMRIIEGR